MRIDARALVAVAATALLAAACAHSTGPVSPPSVESSSGTPAPLPQATAPPCVTADVHARVFAGQGAGGTIAGSIWVWSSGPECELAGAVSLTGLTAAHVPIPGVTANRQLVPAVQLILPAHMGTPVDGGTAQSGYVVADVAGLERDDPQGSGGTCAKANEVTPASFVLTFGSLALTVPNLDPGSVTANRAIYGCRGRILLEGVTQSN